MKFRQLCCTLLFFISFGASLVANAQSAVCPDVENLVIASGTKPLSIKVSDIPGGERYADYDLKTPMEAREGLFSDAYAAAMMKCCGAASLAFGTPAVVAVTYTSGATESFFHGVVDASMGNYAIPGTQKGPGGTSLCSLSNQPPPPDSGSTGGSGSGGGNTGFGASLGPGGFCIKTVSTIPGYGVVGVNYNCYG